MILSSCQSEHQTFSSPLSPCRERNVLYLQAFKNKTFLFLEACDWKTKPQRVVSLLKLLERCSYRGISVRGALCGKGEKSFCMVGIGQQVVVAENRRKASLLKKNGSQKVQKAVHSSDGKSITGTQVYKLLPELPPPLK